MTSLMRGNQSLAARSANLTASAPHAVRSDKLDSTMPAKAMLHACWRLGDSSCVSITVHREQENSSALELIVVQNGSSTRYCGTIDRAIDSSEVRMTFVIGRVDDNGSRSNPSSATLDVVWSAPSNIPLLITDLPQRLGLLGGSYVLERLDTMPLK
jgi:hypothetical protein